MSSKHKLTRSFRSLSAALYLINLTICICFAIFNPRYLEILVGVLTSIVTLIMLCVTMEAPPFLMNFLDTKRFAFLFTFRGRYIMDLFVALFMYAMGIVGIIMGTTTLVLIFGIRCVGVREPEAFGELFRQPVDADDQDNETYYTDGDTYEGTYDGTYAENTVESGRR
uniref:COPI associated protein n=1 Tax=Trieres chinensis TaxID=1514140 RepID=A0A7S2ABA9_TRICV|mmetsp:Transcript_9758/g.20627  ORF Transcript_9758/g.20627 Transcript_9758/m.20627 type:complete len:168 (+) Transcript_9758:153-656(+)